MPRRSALVLRAGHPGGSPVPARTRTASGHCAAHAREGFEEQVETLFPIDAGEEEDDFTVVDRPWGGLSHWEFHGVRNDQRVCGYAQFAGLHEFLFAGVVNARGAGQDAAFQNAEGEPLQPGAAIPDAPAVERAERPDDVGDSRAVGQQGGGKRGVGEERVDVDQVELAHVPREPAGERPREGVEARLAREIPERGAVFLLRKAVRDGQPAGAVVVGGGDVDFHAGLREGAGEGAHQHAGSAALGADRGDHVEDFMHGHEAA
jgi:hypothetical protein